MSPPDAIIALVMKYPQVVLNIRPTHWPQNVTDAFRAKHSRRNRENLMFPPFARFLSKLNAGTKVLICHQNTKGGIVTLTRTIKEILWTGKGDSEQKGDYASIWFLEPNGSDRSLWGNFVLAISGMHPSAPLVSGRDPEGFRFVEMFTEFGIV